jgi:hypothetical protein
MNQNSPLILNIHIRISSVQILHVIFLGFLLILSYLDSNAFLAPALPLAQTVVL